jgi:hypothetical protein
MINVGHAHELSEQERLERGVRINRLVQRDGLRNEFLYV